MSRLLFLNLPVQNLQASRNFFEGLGFRFDGKCRDEYAACLIVNAQAFVTLIQREHFAEFVTGPVSDASEATALTIAISADDREAVNRLAGAALDAGATPAKGPQDYGFVYQRSFRDLDGFLWEVIWMDPVDDAKNPGESAAGAD